jgi:hypothetical protein
MVHSNVHCNLGGGGLAFAKQIRGATPGLKGSNNRVCWLDVTVLSALNYIIVYVNLLETNLFPIRKE